MRKMLTGLLLLVLLGLAWFIGLPLFKNSSPQNRLLVDVVSCRMSGCKQIEADFHDYGGLKKVPNFISIAKGLERVRFYIFELEDISALLRLENLKEVDVRGLENISQADVEQLTDKGVTVLWR